MEHARAAGRRELYFLSRQLIFRCGYAGLVALLLAARTFGAEASQAEKPTCTVLATEGKVEVARKGLVQWAAARTNEVLQIGDRLRTGLRSRATLRWSDLSVV